MVASNSSAGSDNDDGGCSRDNEVTSGSGEGVGW